MFIIMKRIRQLAIFLIAFTFSVNSKLPAKSEQQSPVPSALGECGTASVTHERIIFYSSDQDLHGDEEAEPTKERSNDNWQKKLNEAASQQLNMGNAYIAFQMLAPSLLNLTIAKTSEIQIGGYYIAAMALLRTDTETFRRNYGWVCRGISAGIDKQKATAWKGIMRLHVALGMLHQKMTMNESSGSPGPALSSAAEKHLVLAVDIALGHDCAGCLVDIIGPVSGLYTRDNSTTKRSIAIKNGVMLGLDSGSLEPLRRVQLLVAQSHINEVDGDIQGSVANALTALEITKEHRLGARWDVAEVLKNLALRHPGALSERMRKGIFQESLALYRERIWHAALTLPYDLRKKTLSDPLLDLALEPGKGTPEKASLLDYELNFRNLSIEAEKAKIESRGLNAPEKRYTFLGVNDIKAHLADSEVLIIIGSMKTEFGKAANPYRRLDNKGHLSEEWIKRQDKQSQSYYAVFLTRNKEDFLWLGPVHETNNFLTAWIGMVEQNHSDVLRTSMHLGSLLQDDLTHVQQATTLFIVPHGIYASIPLSALMRLGIKQSFGRRIHVLSSARQFVNIKMASELNRSTELAAIFADAEKGAGATNVTVNTSRASVDTLHYAKEEALALAKLLAKSNSFAKEKFTIAEFERAAKDAGVIHVATHLAVEVESRAHEDEMTEKGLLFSGGNESRQVLTPRAISSLKLENVELLTLAACESGVTLSNRTDSWSGLQRAFFAAGVKSTITSLWKVDDEATAEFMRRLYARIQDGLEIDKAIEDTQHDFVSGIPGRSEWKDLFYWAAWQLVGDWRPIKEL